MQSVLVSPSPVNAGGSSPHTRTRSNPATPSNRPPDPIADTVALLAVTDMAIQSLDLLAEQAKASTRLDDGSQLEKAFVGVSSILTTLAGTLRCGMPPAMEFEPNETLLAAPNAADFAEDAESATVRAAVRLILARLVMERYLETYSDESTFEGATGERYDAWWAGEFAEGLAGPAWAVGYVASGMRRVVLSRWPTLAPGVARASATFDRVLSELAEKAARRFEAGRAAKKGAAA